MNAKKQEVSAPSIVAQTLSLSDVAQGSELWSLPSARGFAVCIRSLLQNWRQGTVGCKGRSDVAFSGKKPWKQKGTGRARAGDAKSPLWRGGGVVFGPQARDKKLKVSKSLRRGVLRSLVSRFAEAGNLLALDWAPPVDRPKTSLAYSVLKNAGMLDRKVILFLPANDFLSAASFANIPSVHVLSFDEPNVYHLADTTRWLVLKRDLAYFKEMVSRWS